MALTLAEAKKAILQNTVAGNATIIRSPSGFGKSTMLMAAHRERKALNAKKGKTTGLGVIFAATQTPTDLVGIPWKGSKTFTLPDGSKQTTLTVTEPSVPLWMLDVETGKPATLFDDFTLLIEEYGQGEPDTKRALAEVFLNGGTPPFYLPEGSARWACTNSGARYGVTKDFHFTHSRRTVIDIRPDHQTLVDHWDAPYRYMGKEWQMSPVWKSWVRTGGNVHIFEKEPEEDGPWCNPRTMSAADRAYQVMVADNNGKDLDPRDKILLEVFGGTIGAPAAQSAIGHLRFRDQLPTYEEVISDPKGCKLPSKGDLQMLMAYEMANFVQRETLAQALVYMSRLETDMTNTFVSALIRRSYKEFINEPAMQAWIRQNSAIVAIVSSLAMN